jgi:RNA polymerase sigma-70 factor, ECF subfamily
MAVTASVSETLRPEELIQRVAVQQDRAAFASLFQHYGPRVKSWLMGHGLSEPLAEDILQETWINVWQHASRFDPARASFATWLYTIARHRKIDRLRQNRDLPLPDFQDDALFGATHTDAVAEQEFLDKALKALPPDQNRLIYDMFYRGKTQHEIAREQDLPLGTVKSRTRLALAKLRKTAEILTLWLIFTLTTPF